MYLLFLICVYWFQILMAIGAFVFLFLPHARKFHYDNISRNDNEYDMSSKDSSEEFIKYDNSYMQDESDNFHVLWDEYQTFCHSTAWEKANVAVIQQKCSLLDYIKVNWHGYVVDIRIVKIENAWKSFANRLPIFLKEHFQCYFGEEYNFDCQSKKGDAYKECHFLEQIAQREKKKCHLEKYNM